MMSTPSQPAPGSVYTVENFNILNNAVQEWAQLIESVEEIRNDDTLAPQRERLLAAAGLPGLRQRNEDVIADQLGYEPGYVRKKKQP